MLSTIVPMEPHPDRRKTSALGAILLAAALCLSASAVLAESGTPQDLSWLADALGFEMEPDAGRPGGWSGGPEETIFVDEEIVHGGERSVRIERRPDSPSGFSSVTMNIPVTFGGSQLTFRGYLRIEDVSDYVGLWMREDGDAAVLQFDNMSSQKVNGTTDWVQYEITLPLDRDAKSLSFGALIAGTGTMWADDLELLADGKPVWEAPPSTRPETILDRDTEFDDGSGIVLDALSEDQIENLATLGRVWGFLKYHHPAVTAGEYHWDYELLRVLPSVLEAASREQVNARILAWIQRLQAVGLCSPCAELPESGELHLLPELDWISDEDELGAKLSEALRWIHRNRSTLDPQFYVALVPNVRNPEFLHEPNYAGVALPDPGFQLLALFRFWSIIEYWFPYRDLLEDDWDAVLSEFVPRVALAGDRVALQLELMALIARVHDTHCNLWSSLAVRPPVGPCQLPIVVRFVEDEAVVAGAASKGALEATGLRPGDVIDSIDGASVDQLVDEWTPLYAASNQPTRLRDIGRSLTRGDCGPCRVVVRRGEEILELTLERVSSNSVDSRAGLTHDRPGDVFQMLDGDVGYLKLSAVERGATSDYVDRILGLKGLVIDIRNYPSDFVVFSLGAHLVGDVTPFARFTKGDLSNPGTFSFTENVTVTPGAPTYEGRIVILVDEATQSSAEYHSMAFRATPGSLVVGSTTAGADGNASWFALPGGLRSMISGIGVFYPDKSPTQRIGIVPDVEIRPTIAGIREGRDEVLEEAIRLIHQDAGDAPRGRR